MALRENIIGFDRQLKNDWLNKTAFLVADGNKPDDVRIKFRESSEDQTSDALRKTINLLMGIWSKVPEEIIPLRDQALDLFLNADDSERKIIHYFLALANYPFFYDVCVLAGRALKLADSLNSKQIITKIQEKWGERSTTIRAVQRSLKTIEHWGWLSSKKQGNFESIDDAKKSYLPEKYHGFAAKCILFGSLRDSMILEEIIQNPCIFPFHFELNLFELKQSKGLVVESRGKGDTVITLRK